MVSFEEVLCVYRTRSSRVRRMAVDASRLWCGGQSGSMAEPGRFAHLGDLGVCVDALASRLRVSVGRERGQPRPSSRGEPETPPVRASEADLRS